MKPANSTSPLLRALGAAAALLLSLSAAEAATWVNFSGNFQWGTAANWSPSTVPNGDGAEADFQVDVPFAVTIQQGNSAGPGTPKLSTLKLGDINGNSAITLLKTGTTSRLDFTNSAGGVRIEKRGDGNDVISVGRNRIFNNDMTIAFTGGSGTLTINNDNEAIDQGANYSTRVTITGPGTLFLLKASTHTGGTVISGSTVEISGGENRLGNAASALTIGNNGVLRANGSVTFNAGRAVVLKGGGNAVFSAVAAADTITIPGSISSDVNDPSSLVVAGPGTVSVSAGGYTATGPLTVLNDAGLTVDASLGTTLNAPSVVLGNGGNVRLTLNFGALSGANPSGPAINGASLNAGAASISLRVSGSGFVTGQFPLIDYSGSALPNLNNFALDSLPPGVLGTLVNNAENTSIDLNISLVVNALTWYGGASDIWDIGTSLNWNSGAAAYNEYGAADPVGDVVTFDDALEPTAVRNSINLATTLRPAVVNLANNFLSYTFGGAGKLSGATVLNKGGIDVLTINTANDHTGVNTLTQGTVRLGHDSALGAGTIALAGAALTSDGTTARTLANPVRYNSASVLGDTVNSGLLTFTGPLDFANGGRDMTVNSDVVFSGTLGNGGLDQKFGLGALNFNSVTGEMSAGNFQIENGAVSISGGSIEKSSGGIRVVCMDVFGLSHLSISGGALVTMSAPGANLRIGSATSPTSNDTSTNVVDVAASLVWTTDVTTGGQIQMGAGSALAQLNLKPGGVLRPIAFVNQATFGISEVNFDGGVLMPLRDRADFLRGLTAAYVRAGGAIIDTDGKDITIGQALLDGGEGGGLTKNGAGQLTLTGANTYTGDTTVNGGVLLITPVHAATGGIFVSDGGVAGYVSTAPGESVAVPSTTVAAGGALQVVFSGQSGNPSAPAATIGTLTLNGAVPILVRGAGLAPGTIPLVQYTTLAGGGSVTAGQLPQGVIGTINNNTATKTIELVISSIMPLVWTGGNDNRWDVNTTVNWTIGGNSTVFRDGDAVLFDDSAALPLVAMQETVSPGGVTANNTALAYTLTGVGKLSGPTGITKAGANSLTIDSVGNDFTGEVNVMAGTFVAGHASALGATSGGTIVQSGATLDTTGKGFLAERITVSGSGVNGQGALISSGANQNSLRFVTMAGDTTIGSVNGVQWGFQGLNPPVEPYLVGNGFKLTKVGRGDFLLKDLGETGLGDIEIVETALSFQFTTTMGDPAKICAVQSNGILAFWEQSVQANKVLVLNGGMVRFNSTTPTDFIGPVTLNGLGHFQGSSTLNLMAPVGGDGVLRKTGSGFLYLAAANTYTGSTVVSNGTVQLGPEGSIALSSGIFVDAGATFDVTPLSNFTLGAAQTLSGSGTINGNVIANGAVTPGASVGALTFNNDLTLRGETVMEVSAEGGLSADRVIVTGALAYGGALRVALTGATTLAANDTFDLFDWGAQSGSFTSVTLPAGYTWDTTQLAVDGTIRVVSVQNLPPTFGTMTFAGLNLTLSGSGGAPNGSYSVLASPDIALPIGQWTEVSANTFDASGNFSFTITVNPNEPAQFFQLRAP